MRDGWYVVERYDDKQRSVYKIETNRWKAGIQEHVEVTIHGIGDDNVFFSVEEFLKIYWPIQMLNLDSMPVEEIL